MERSPVIAILVRYGKYERLEKANLQEAFDFVNAIEEEGQAYAIGVYDPASRTVHVSDILNSLHPSEGFIYNQRIDTLKDLGLDFSRVEFYHNPFHDDI